MNSANANASRESPISANEQHCLYDDRSISVRTHLSPVVNIPSPTDWDAESLPTCDKPYRSQLVTVPAPTCKRLGANNDQSLALTTLLSPESVQMQGNAPPSRQKSLFLDPTFVCRYCIVGKTLGVLLGCMQIICTLPEVIYVGKSCHVLSRENAIFVLFSAFITVVIGLAFGLLPGLLFKLSYLLICLYQMGDSIAIFVSEPCDNMVAVTGVRFLLNSICMIALVFVWKRL